MLVDETFTDNRDCLVEIYRVKLRISFYGIHSYCLSWMNEDLGIMIKRNSYLKKYVLLCFWL